MTANQVGAVACWQCGDSMARPDETHRYCRRCGARLYQKCPYCGEGVSVYAGACPGCRKPFRLCDAHYVLYSVDQDGCEVDDCKQTLSDCSTSHLCWGGDYGHTRAFRQTDSGRTSSFMWQESIPVGVPVSRAGSRHGCLFFGTRSGHARGLALCQDVSAWPAPSPTGHDLTDADPVLSASHVCFLSRNAARVHRILTGELIAEIRFDDLIESQGVAIGNDLVLLGRTPHGQYTLRSYPLATGVSAPSHQVMVDAPPLALDQPLTAPVVSRDNTLWFVDQARQLRSWSPSDEQPEVRFENPDGHTITLLMLVEEREGDNQTGPAILFVGHRMGQSQVLAWEPETSRPPAQVTETLPGWIRGAAVSYPHLVICRDDRFEAYDITGEPSPVWRHQASPAALDFLLVQDRDRLYLVYVLPLPNQPTCSIRWTEVFGSEDTPGRLRDVFREEQPSILYAADGIIVCERKSGRFSWYRVPPQEGQQ